MTLDLDSLRSFLEVAERKSITRAAEERGLRKAKVSSQIRSLEGVLGAKLFHRTTRVVRLTEDGKELVPRARKVLVEADALSAAFSPARSLAGRVRVELPQRIGTEVIMPRLPDFLRRYPNLRIDIRTSDQRADVEREAIDCVLRIGELEDSSLTRRHLGAMHVVSCASPAYLARFGSPQSPDELAHHEVVHWMAGPDMPPSFDYEHEGVLHRVPMRSTVSVNSTAAYRAACLAGLGIIQAPRVGLRDLLERGDLLEVLPAHPHPPLRVSLLHGYRRNAPRRVKIVMRWVAEQVHELLDA